MRKLFIAAALIMALAGCATRTHQITTNLDRTAGQPKIMLMPLDVELSLISAGGVHEVRADWTKTANDLLVEAIRAENHKHSIRLVVFDDDMPDGPERDLAHQLMKLHGVVGGSILTHVYNPQLALPTKADDFDWGLGPAAKTLKETSKADYALFIRIRDSYTSGGRALVAFLAAAAFGAHVEVGSQVGFASLVDLNTGKIIWFNLLARGTGDLRNAEGAANTAENLLSQLPQ